MNTLTKHNAPVIAGVEITTDAEGRFNLNALHKASGGDNGKRPSLWLANKQVQELIGELEANLLKNKQSKNFCSAHKTVNVVNGGTSPVKTLRIYSSPPKRRTNACVWRMIR